MLGKGLKYTWIAVNNMSVTHVLAGKGFT
jgi:hypothetical protein